MEWLVSTETTNSCFLWPFLIIASHMLLCFQIFFSACAYQVICGGKIMMSLHLESCLLLAEIMTECKDQNIACAILFSLAPVTIKDRTYW